MNTNTLNEVAVTSTLSVVVNEHKIARLIGGKIINVTHIRRDDLVNAFIELRDKIRELLLTADQTMACTIKFCGDEEQFAVTFNDTCDKVVEHEACALCRATNIALAKGKAN